LKQDYDLLTVNHAEDHMWSQEMEMSHVVTGDGDEVLVNTKEG